jgi:hypothetical protein
MGDERYGHAYRSGCNLSLLDAVELALSRNASG